MAVQKQKRKISYKVRGGGEEGDEEKTALGVSNRKRPASSAGGTVNDRGLKNADEEETEGIGSMQDADRTERRYEEEDNSAESKRNEIENAVSGLESEKEKEEPDGDTYESKLLKSIVYEKIQEGIGERLELKEQEEPEQEENEEADREIESTDQPELEEIEQEKPESEEAYEVEGKNRLEIRKEAESELRIESELQMELEPGIEPEAGKETDAKWKHEEETKDEYERETGYEHATETGNLHEKRTWDVPEDETGNVTGAEGETIAARNIRNFSGRENDHYELTVYQEDVSECGRMEEIRRYRDQETVSKTEDENGSADEEGEHPGRNFHVQRSSFYRADDQTRNEEEFSGSQRTSRHETRRFSQNAQEPEGESIGKREHISQGTDKAGQESRKASRKSRESIKEVSNAAKDVRDTAGEAGKAAGETMSEAVNSLNVYSEILTRPYETGKRAFSTGKETVSREFRSIRQFASSHKDADEAVSAKAGDLLKAMAIRTFREAVMLPIKLARAVIKFTMFVVTTIATSGVNLLVLLIALILSVAVLAMIIMFAGMLLVSYGYSEGILAF